MRRLRAFFLSLVLALGILNVPKITFADSFFHSFFPGQHSVFSRQDGIRKVIADTTSAPVSITSVGDPVSAPEGILTVTARFTNTSAQPVEVTSVRLNVESRFASTRSEIVNFLHGRPSALLLTRSSLTEPRTVQAGESIEASLTWEYGSLTSGENTWGARGVEVEVVTKDEVFTDRSFAVFTPPHELQASPVAALVSVRRDAIIPWNFSTVLSSAVAQSSVGTPPATSPGNNPPSSQSFPSQSPSNVVSSLPHNENNGHTPFTDSASGSVSSSSAESPSSGPVTSETNTTPTPSSSLPEAATPLSETSTPSSSSSKQPSHSVDTTRLELLQQLQSLAHNGMTFSLDSTAANLMHRENVEALKSTGASLQLGALSNADLVALTQHCAGKIECLQSWTTAGRTISDKQASDLDLNAGVAILDSSATSASFNALQSLGVSQAVVPASALPTDDDKYSTPSARTSVNGIPVLVSDSALNAVVAGKIPSHADADAVQQESASIFSSTFDALHARQLALALSAATYRERPNDSRLVVVQADVSDNSGDVLSALMKAPWVQPVSVAQAFASGEASAQRTPVDESTSSAQYDSELGNDAGVISQSSLSSDLLARIDSARAVYQRVGAIAQEASVLEDVVNRRLAVLVSRGWEASSRQAAVDEFGSEANAMIAGIGSLESSTINVISDSTEIPVTVKSSLPLTVNVRVKLHSQDPRFTAVRSVETRISPGGTSKVLIPVRAFGSANITVQVHIVDGEGNKIGTTQDLSLRLRANWEDIGTIVFAVFFLVLLLLGLWKSLRKGRRSRPLSPEEVRLARIHAAADSHGGTGG